MKTLTYTDNKVEFNIFLYLTYFIACFPILTYGLRSVLIVLWLFFGLLIFIRNKAGKTNKLLKNKYLFLLSIAPFLFLSLTLLYSDNLDSGIKRLVQMISFIVFPMIFYLNRGFFNKKRIKTNAWIFSTSVIILVFYQIISSLLNLDYLLAELSIEEIKLNNLQNLKSIDQETVNGIKLRRFRNYINKLVDTHFTYQGLWISFVLFILLKEVSIKLNKIKITGLIIISTSLFFWLFTLSTRMPIIVIFIAFFLTYYLTNKFRIKTFLLIICSSVLFLFISYKTIDTFQVRVNEIIKTKFDLPTKGDDIENYNSINVRNGIYLCSINVIKHNWFFGVGVGDSQDQLDKCYKEKLGAKIYTWEKYNTHNQFLFFLVTSGIIGFSLFLVLIIAHLRESLKRKENIYFYLIIIICLISMTENILLRSDGVLFFSFFCNLFLFNGKSKPNDCC